MELLGADALKVRASVICATIKVADVLRELGRPLDISGTQQIFCPNPAHPERRPSARYYEESNHIYCFRCAERWDPVGLVRVSQRTSLEGAIDWITARFRIPALADMAPTVIATLLKPRETQDFSQLVANVEQRIKGAREPLGAEGFHRCWLAFDTVQELYSRGEVDAEQYEAMLGEILQRTEVH